MLSPQRGSIQLLRQASRLSVLPSSHCSLGSGTPSPQNVQSSRHAVRLVRSLGATSQVSLYNSWIMPSPHLVQLSARHPSIPGGSQVSGGSTIPLPQGGSPSHITHSVEPGQIVSRGVVPPQVPLGRQPPGHCSKPQRKHTVLFSVQGRIIALVVGQIKLGPGLAKQPSGGLLQRR